MALESWNGQSLGHGVAHLLAARERLTREPTGPWSIAELELTDDDFEKLLSWARRADGPSVKRLIERTDLLPVPEPSAHVMLPGDAFAGLLLLALCAECTARLGSTEAPWAASVKALEDCSLRRTLFSEGGAALPPLKDALLAAAHRCWMRSGDLEDPTTNRWYQLLLLQGGLPRRDAALLPRRLGNPDGRTFLVGALQQDVPSFRSAWDALERFRRRQVSRDRAEKALAACPFFRRPYDEILDAALLNAAERDGLDRPSAGGSALDVAMRLDWPPGASAPSATLLPSFAPADDLGSRVVLSVDGSAKATYRRVNGTLARFGGGELTVPLASRWTISAKGQSETELAEVDLFPEDEPIACFDESGARCGPEAQAVRYVVAREPITPEPVQRVVWLEAQGLAVAAVEPGTTVMTTEGVHLWPSAGRSVADPQALALQVADWRVGGEVGALTVRLIHAPSVRVKAARIGSASFSVDTSKDEGEAGTTTLRGVVPASSAAPETRLTVTATASGRVFQRTLRFRAFTAASLDGVWLEATSTVEAARLRDGALQVSLGPEYAGHDARLVAGGISTRIDVDARRAARAARILGFGEPLVLCGQEPWLEGPRQVLATCIEDHGALVEHEARDGRLCITHRSNVEDFAEHWLLVWPRHGDPVALSLDTCAPAPAEHVLAVPYRAEGEPRAVALCYGTAVTGASWAADWSSDLASAGGDAATLVKLIRLLSLPVLAPAHLGLVTSRLRQLGLPEATDALVANHEGGEPLELGAGDARKVLRPSGDRDRWPRVARAALLELRLSADAQLDALKRLMDNHFPPLQVTPGVPATPQQLEELAAQKKAQGGPFGAYLRLLLRAGAVHPRDAVCLTPESSRQRSRLAINLADASRGLNAQVLETVKSRQRLRSAALAARRRQLGLDDPSVTSTLAAAAAWVGSASPPDVRLHDALVDERMHQRIQLELLDELAFSRK